MKKWILGLLSIAVILIISAYVFIPSKIVVTSSIKIGASENGAARFLLDEKNWAKWWNAKDSVTAAFSQSNDHFIMNEDTFRISGSQHMSADITIHRSDVQLQSRLFLIAFGVDTTGIEWSGTLDAGNNPLHRFTQYQKAKSLKKDFDRVLQHMRSFLEKPENVYGLTLLRTSITDTLLISTRSTFNTYPGTAIIYNHVKLLQNYAAKNSAIQTGHPIFHVSGTDDKRFELMTAIPINKILAGDAHFSFKRMIPGSFIVSDITGGEYTVAQARKNMDLFFADYHKTSMAINFDMLVTDRIQIPDTAKWVTRLYQPVY